VPVYVSDLHKKMLILLRSGRNPGIRQLKDIAAHLHISPNNFAGYWFSETGGIPDKHVASFCNLFSISYDLLTADLPSFESRLSRPLRGSWSLFTEIAPWSEALRVIPVSAVTRGLYAPEPLDHFSSGDHVRLELQLDSHDMCSFSHVLVLVVDMIEAICLCPNDQFAPDPQIPITRRISIPVAGTKYDYLGFQGAKGRHTIYAILSDRPLIGEIYGTLKQPIEAARLDDLATLFEAQNRQSTLSVIKKTIFVDA
jgi:hypothetical protein